MEFSADPFSSSEISHSCWKMCHNGEVISQELLPSLLPIYRDDETRADYESVANFFYCMDACDTRYMVKRMTLALPIVALGLCVIGCLLCSFFWCKSCRCHYKKICPLRKGSQALLESSSSSSLDHLSTLSSSSASSSGSSHQFGKNSFNSSKAPSSTSMGSGRKGGKVGDIRSNLSSRNGGHGLDSLDSEQANGGLSLSASKNSWMMTPKTSNKNLEESFKRSMRSTASKLGRKLIAMDKESEVRQAEKATRRIMKKNNPNESPENPPPWSRF